MTDLHFTETLLRWWAENGRDLPWRHTRAPYPIWLSEIILQQTRIAQGRAYWERFVRTYPTVEALAAAPEDDVMRLWQGLGYYSRARHLHAAAKQVASAGRFPDTLEGIRALPGVGPYTAAAIGSFAFGLDAAVVDGNVYRVLARYYGISTPVGSDAAKKEFSALAQSLLPAGQAGDFNQAMMDFGATLCTPRSPACDACPLQSRCEAYHTGRVALLPVKGRKTAVQERRMRYLDIHCGGFSAWRKRPEGDIWAGLWEPVLLEDSGRTGTAGSLGTDPQADKAQAADSWAGYGVLTPVAQGVRHQLTHRTLIADAWRLDCTVRPPLPEGWTWIPDAELDRLGKPRLVEILLEEGNIRKKTLNLPSRPGKCGPLTTWQTKKSSSR